MSPGKPSGFGPLSLLWWSVVFAGWALAAVVMAAEWLLARLAPPVVFLGKVLWNGSAEP